MTAPIAAAEFRKPNVTASPFKISFAKIGNKTVYDQPKKLIAATKIKIFLRAGVFEIYANPSLSSSSACFSFSKMFWFSMFFVALSGLGAMLHNTSANSYIQSVVLENRRGRVMSFYALAHQGVIPIGSLILGWAAATFGAPAAMMVSGILCIIPALLLGPKILTSELP